MPEQVIEEIQKRELDQTGTVPTLRARLLRYERYRARGEKPPPTPESLTGKSRWRLEMPTEDDDASMRSDSSSNTQLVRAESVVIREDSPVIREECRP